VTIVSMVHPSFVRSAANRDSNAVVLEAEMTKWN